MEIRRNNIGKNEYIFVCETWETSNAWGHKVTMFRNDYEMLSNKVRYYNRTWEQYRYQSCIKGAVYKLLEDTKQREIIKYKRENDISRLSQARKEEIYKASEFITELRELYNSL